MDELRAYLAPILKEIEARYAWRFEVAALDYLMHYFHSLDRLPTRAEVILCAIRNQGISDKPLEIPGHKMDAFYAQATVLETNQPDLLDTPEIPSSVKPSDTLLQEKMVDEEASRAHNLMASSSHLPPRVIAVLEEQYWVENRYTTRPGYHHYEHLEGGSYYALSFHPVNPAEIPGAFSSKAGFLRIESNDLSAIPSVSTQQIRDANQAAFPLILAQFTENHENERCTLGGFTNTLPYPGEMRKIKPGDRLFLLGKFSEQGDKIVQNQYQAVIFNAYALGENNPILRVFNLGYQTLLFAVLEILNQSIAGCGVDVHTAWDWEDFWTKPLLNSCLIVVPDYQKHLLTPLVERENCPCIEIGEITELGEVVFLNGLPERPLTQLAWEFLAHFPIRSLVMDDEYFNHVPKGVESQKNNFSEQLESTLKRFSIADKSFLMTQIDRTCTGLVARDIMVGPWQVPVADVGVTATEFKDYRGEALAIGSCLISASGDPTLAAKIALNEVLTNIAAAAVVDISAIHLIIQAGYPVAVYEILNAWAEPLGIVVNKVEAYGSYKTETGDISITAFAPVIDIRKTLTPQWVMDDETDLIVIIWEDIENLAPFFKAIQTLNKDDLLLAYHDISEGGLACCLLEMAFCSHCGFSVDLPDISPFVRYGGGVIQTRRASRTGVVDFLNRCGLEGKIHLLGEPLISGQIIFRQYEKILYDGSRTYLHRLWSLPDVKDIFADQAYGALLDTMDPGLHETLTFDPNNNIVLPYIGNVKPSLAILRFPGGSGHLEMAAAFDRVGFECIDVSILDIINGEEDLKPYQGLAIGGSGIEGNILPFAQSVLANDRVSNIFKHFFQRSDTFTLGVGSGCQWLALIKDWIPGADHWPSFQRNASSRFEGRWVLVKIRPSNSIFLREMEDSLIPIPIACEQGRLLFPDLELEAQQLIPLVYADHYERSTEEYPFNPTGSQMGACGFASRDGRVLGMVGHPERACRSVQQSWRYRYLQTDAPWLRLFRNARQFIAESSGVTFFDPTQPASEVSFTSLRPREQQEK